MEYSTQRDMKQGKDISPAEMSPFVGTPRLSLPDDAVGEGCGCETAPVMPLPEMPSCCAAVCDPCGEHSWGLNGYPLAMVYAPCQSFRNLYDVDTALARGTLFGELDLPIETADGKRGGCGCGRGGKA